MQINLRSTLPISHLKGFQKQILVKYSSVVLEN